MASSLGEHGDRKKLRHRGGGLCPHRAALPFADLAAFPFQTELPATAPPHPCMAAGPWLAFGAAPRGLGVRMCHRPQRSVFPYSQDPDRHP